MKRLLPLFLLLALAIGLVRPAPVQAQDKVLILTAVDDTASTFLNTTIEIDVLANDIETNPARAKVLDVIVSGPTFGTATIDRNGTIPITEDDRIVYTPPTNFSGTDELQYRVTSEPGGQSDIALVTIFVNRPPTANPDRFVVPPNDRVFLEVVNNDTDPDGDALTISGIALAPKHGTVVVSPGAPPALSYNPTDGYIGPDSLDYILSDGKNGRDTARVQIVVTSTPVAVDDVATTLPNTPVTISVLNNDSDADGEDLSVVAITDPPDRGTVAIVNNRTQIRYTPNANFTGTDTFKYQIIDESGATAEATVTVRVNNAPVAVNDAASTRIGQAIVIDVLENDTDADGDALSLDAVVTPPSHGTTQIVGNSIRYTPEAGFFGTDTFTYRLRDAAGGTAIGTVTVTVIADAFVQVVHNAPGAGDVDIYVNDVRVVNNLSFQEATPYTTIAAGEATIDITDGAASNNDNPLFTTEVTLSANQAIGVIANGTPGENFDVAIEEDARREADDEEEVEFYIVNGVPDAPEDGLDLRVLDPGNSNLPSGSLANGLEFNEVTNYRRVEPAIYNIDLTSDDNATLYDVFQFGLGDLEGQSFVLVISGRIDDGSIELLGFDADGDPIRPDVVTSTDGDLDVPGTFALHGNFPNPFNPRTTITFDLPAAARVHLEVVDVLGRRVLVTAPRALDAGYQQTLGVEAGHLASGPYFYRLVAETATETLVQTGRMTLIK